ncbi:hypothetical protein H310_14755 [Aphanomyces invadans]|uniref:Uncharacterized protein n=1 Tax=Aphanomyces invadans TaxID=157072 RepID=A0A024TA38_9STRA|nr:hypothetical protein H310_14755 [Aphanomyces invadans]ETV90476.1 hypothetical protein H310_14755 [Aphanomyces invadans]|eukprot:XP_008880904.1 hypothetical protein H310_14755 [Aphanomyces invadans]
MKAQGKARLAKRVQLVAAPASAEVSWLKGIASPGALIVFVKTKRSVTDKVHVKIDMSDTFAEESRDGQVEMQLPALQPSENMDVVEFRLRYVNVLQSMIEKASSIVTIGRPSATTYGNDTILRITAVEAIESAQAQATLRNLDESKRFLLSAINVMYRGMANLRLDAKETTSILLADLEECMTNLSSKAVSRGHGRMAQMLQMHWMQSPNYITVDEAELSVGECAVCGGNHLGAPQQQAASAPGGYMRIGNSMQMQMMQKAFKVTKE